MSLLTVAQDVALKVGLEKPSAVASSTDREHQELLSFINEVALQMVDAHDWEVLKTLQTETGDGSTTEFDLPSDFLRFPKDQRIWSSRIETPFTHIASSDQWLELDVRSYEFVIGAWTKIGGQIGIKPAMTSTETAKYYYITDKFAESSGGTGKTAFDADDDVFKLSERVLRLGTVWYWKHSKQLPADYDEDIFRAALGKAISEDKGARHITIGRNRVRSGVSIAYPKTITPAP